MTAHTRRWMVGAGWFAQALFILFLCGNCQVDGNYQLADALSGFGGEFSGTAGLAENRAPSGGESTGGKANGTGNEGGIDPGTSNGGSSAGTGGEVIPATGGTGNTPQIGSACATEADCPDGHCVDGVCCESECTGCNACAAELTGKADGICAPALAGQDPHNACDDETAINPCGNDGTCDGAGACRKVGTSQVCAAAACSGSTYTPAATCDGFGKCGTPAAESCGLYPCTPTGCAKECSSQSDCSETSYCKIPSGQTTGTCTAKNPNGTPATQAFECASGVVADGYCCDQICTGCRACSGSPLTSGSVGQCLPVVAGQVAHNACTASGTPCGLDGTCDGAGSCRFSPREGESCGGNPSNLCTIAGTYRSGTCQGVTTKSCPAPTEQCRGNGTCDPATGNCNYPNAANGTPCNDNNACTQTDTCQSGNCVGSNPKTCSGSTVCKTGSCNPTTGACFDSGNASNSTSCNDNNACTTSDHCQDGACTGTAIACNSPPACKIATGATCSGGTCSYPQNRTDGQTDSACPQATPYCFGGSCKQCTQNNHCPTESPTCSNNTCVCRQKRAGNLLTNPGFDSQTVVNSTTSTAMNTWINQGSSQVTSSNWIADAENCPASKAYFQTGGQQLYQCVTVSSNTDYSFGGKILSNGVTRFAVEWYASTNCSGMALSSSTVTPPASSTYVAVTQTAHSAGAKSAKFFPQYVGDIGGRVDQVFLNPSPSCAPNCY